MSLVHPPLVATSELNANLLERLIYGMTGSHTVPWTYEQRGPTNSCVVIASDGSEIFTFHSLYPEKDEELAKELIRLAWEIDCEKEDMS